MLPQPGTFPVWVLNGRPSASADASRVAEILRIRAMTARERVEHALLLGLQSHLVREATPPKDHPGE
jgi:hypothetical protein